MTAAAAPLLWLYGPPGVGKSTVGWEIHSRLATAGVPVGFADADQLGLCYPTPADDPDNHRVKAANLAAVWPNLLATGARCIVFSGGVTEPGRVHQYIDGLRPAAAVTLCRLRVRTTELRSRLPRRGWSPDLVAASVTEARDLDGGEEFADLCVTTDGLSVGEVAETVLRQAGGWPGTGVSR
ncbi:AAA family ATPase [Streptomyces sp. RFCAC02]|uniref:AAA family ATPase n=1 Tax=Streptomyces sp. RFCAC02 TaxID=2499143 RepID=UPI00101FBF65|nr:AAA family ATPase [Streptomyces sp. RFCAC02]